MIYRFDHYRLNTATQELHAGEELVELEPQVFALLVLLIENRERVVGKDELVSRIWRDRVVSDAAISSRVKSARKAVSDDGSAQRLIRTIHGVGFRFVGAVESAVAVDVAAPSRAVETSSDPTSMRPSIAVLPFAPSGDPALVSTMADAIPYDILVELSRLRWLFVTARASSFQFRPPVPSLEVVRAKLGVGYVLSGAVDVDGKRISVSVTLDDLKRGGVLWGDRYSGSVDDIHAVRERIVTAVVTALDLRIPGNEARHALATPENLDAWSAYHVGLHHMYRFDKEGNRQAAHYFNRAITLEPSFARAYAGLSFALFEDAFLRVTDDVPAAVTLARRYAEDGLNRDALDPFCNLVMGRALWLTGDHESSLPWLERAVTLNPSYAQGKYSRGLTEALIGATRDARGNADEAMQLSPLDPLLYGMFGVRALGHLGDGDLVEALPWAERAARAPRAHAFIALIAAVANQVNGETVKANGWVASARSRHPGISGADFLATFPFRDERMRGLMSQALRRLGL